MVLTKEQVRALAAAAWIGITEEELAVLTPAMNRTGQYIETIREAPIPEGITEEGGGKPATANPGRKDQVQPSWSREAILRNAPQQAEFCFQTPRFFAE